MQDFDPVAFKETTRQQWQKAALAWHRWTPTLQAWLGPVTEAMLDLAKLKAGDRVEVLHQDPHAEYTRQAWVSLIPHRYGKSSQPAPLGGECHEMALQRLARPRPDQ